jgi:hypothetical protein
VTPCSTIRATLAARAVAVAYTTRRQRIRRIAPYAAVAAAECYNRSEISNLRPADGSG